MAGPAWRDAGADGVNHEADDRPHLVDVVEPDFVATVLHLLVGRERTGAGASDEDAASGANIIRT
jgi:hypothetical protein